MFQLILSPAKGWVDIAREGEPVSLLASEGFYPFLGLTSLTVFIQRIYHVDLTVGVMLERAIVTFMMYFAAYFIGVAVLSGLWYKGRGDSVEQKHTHTFVIYTLGLLALINIIANCIPVELSVTFFLPIYVAIIMWKADRYMGVEPHDTGRFMLISIPGVLAPPYILNFLFNLIIPG